MKHFSIYLAIILMLIGNIKVTAQTECPNIEWMRFFNSDNNNYCNINQVNDHYNEIVTGSYDGAFTFGTYNLPTASNFIRNSYIAKIDSSGAPLWVKVAEHFTYGAEYYLFSNPVLDSVGNIYTVLDFTWKTVFDGTTYVTNGQQQNSLFIKMSPQGQVLTTHLFEKCSLMLRHIDESQNLYFSADFENNISIDNHTYTSNGGKDILVFKLNAQLQLLWAQQIGGDKDETTNFWPESIKVDSQNNVYIVGSFKSSSIALGSFLLNNSNINGNQPETFLAKINSSGNYSWAKSIADPDCYFGAMAIDNSGNIYLVGSFTDTLTLGNATIPAVPANSLNSILIQYNPIADSFVSMIFRGGWNSGEHLLYLPQKNMMVLSGVYDTDTVDFYIDSLAASNNNRDFYILGIDLSNETEQMLPQWIVHSHGNGAELIVALAKDFKDDVYVSGSYISGIGAFGNFTFPAIPGNSNYIANTYQAKLSFLNREVTVSNGVLTAVQDSAIYQWLDCSNGMQPVPGATQQSFDPGQPGSYAVQVSNSFCSVVSDCLSTTGISETQRLSQVRIYPNPVVQTLHLNGLPPGMRVTVFDVLGRTVYSATAKEVSLDINTYRWSTGVYMLRLSKDGVTHLEKVVKD